jgi:hypothetical protein
MKVFVKTVDTDREAFTYVRNEFSKFSEAKVKEGIFVGPQTQEVMQDPDFHITLNDTEKSACNAFKSLCTNFLGNHKGENYREIASEMLKCFQVGYSVQSVSDGSKHHLHLMEADMELGRQFNAITLYNTDFTLQ